MTVQGGNENLPRSPAPPTSRGAGRWDLPYTPRSMDPGGAAGLRRWGV